MPFSKAAFFIAALYLIIVLVEGAPPKSQLDVNVAGRSHTQLRPSKPLPQPPSTSNKEDNIELFEHDHFHLLTPATFPRPNSQITSSSTTASTANGAAANGRRLTIAAFPPHPPPQSTISLPRTPKELKILQHKFDSIFYNEPKSITCLERLRSSNGHQEIFLRSPKDGKSYYLKNVDQVGKGSSARVYRATDLRNGMAVAIKVFTDTYSSSMIRAWDGATREAKIHEIMGTAYGEPIFAPLVLFSSSPLSQLRFLPMKFIDGQTLEDELNDPNSPFDKLALYEGGKKQLKKLHKNGYTHNDAHLLNFMVERRSGRVFLIDFGSASRSSSSIKARMQDFEVYSRYAAQYVRGVDLGSPLSVAIGWDRKTYGIYEPERDSYHKPPARHIYVPKHERVH